MTAEKIYHYYITQNISDAQCEQLQEAFALDEHEVWYAPGNDSFGSQGNGDSDSQGDSNQKPDSDSSQSQNNENSTAVMTLAEAQEVWKSLQIRYKQIWRRSRNSMEQTAAACCKI